MMQRNAFTLVEILLVVGISVVLFSIITPISINFYRNQQLVSVSEEILQNLRRTQALAMFSQYDSNFGVFFQENQYTLFKGSSFSARDTQYDEIFNIPEIVRVGGLNEISFSKVKGLSNIVPAHCGGICNACSGFQNRTSCLKQSGCSWNRVLRCYGNCNECGNYTDQSSCIGQLGCNWIPESIGGNIIITSDNETRTITINQEGAIGLE